MTQDRQGKDYKIKQERQIRNVYITMNEYITKEVTNTNIRNKTERKDIMDQNLNSDTFNN